MILPEISLLSILPAIVLSLAGIAIMVLDPFLGVKQKAVSGWIGLGGALAALLGMVPMSGHMGHWYAGLWIVDQYSIFFHAVALLIAALTTLLSMEYLERENINHSEYYALILFATVGSLLMAGTTDLMMMFLGLEILSISTYILAGFRRTDARSNESALKYFLLGSFASAFFLYGVALLFGATGSTNVVEIAAAIEGARGSLGLAQIGAGLLLIALGFKVAVAPFHVWAPDVYEGAPTPVTAFMSVGPKAAGFAIFLRIFLTAFPALEDRWIAILWALAALTMILGNVVALVQTNIKRMLAYSSIAHAGYVMVAFAAGGQNGVSAALAYLMAYSIMNLGAFAVITALSRTGDRLVRLDDYAGLGLKRPGLAALLSIFLLSLAGVPGTIGFAGKFLIFKSAVESGLIGLTVLGVLTTVVSFYYYLYVIVQMYMKDPKDDFSDVRIGMAIRLVLAVGAVGTLYFGIFPTRLFDWAVLSALR